MKVEYIKSDCAYVYVIEAAGNSLTEAVQSGLDQACDAVDRIVEMVHVGEKTSDSYAYVIDIALKCPDAELLGEEVTTNWAQAETNLQNFFPMNSLVFWAVIAKWPEPEPQFVQKIHAFFARIAAQNADMTYSNLNSSHAYRLGEFEAMMLAAANRQYLPCYTSLLRHWDMLHGTSQQYDTINELALAHGPCPEVDDLIATRLTEAPGPHGFEQFQELYPKIVEWYGDPLESPVYKCAEQKMARLGSTNHTALQQVFAGDWS
jgi:hypothetical protein